MKKQFIKFFSMVFMMLIATVMFSKDWIVTNASDDGDPNSLRCVIEQAKDEDRILIRTNTIYLYSSINIDKPLVIIGDSNKKKPMIQTWGRENDQGAFVIKGVQGGRVIFHNLGFSNFGIDSKIKDGGAMIIMNSNVEINRCDFKELYATEATALYICDSKVRIDNSEFTTGIERLLRFRFGPQIHANRSTINMYKTKFYEIQASEIMAMRASDCDIYLDDVSVYRNLSYISDSCKALELICCNITLEGCYIAYNYSYSVKDGAKYDAKHDFVADRACNIIANNNKSGFDFSPYGSNNKIVDYLNNAVGIKL